MSNDSLRKYCFKCDAFKLVRYGGMRTTQGWICSNCVSEMEDKKIDYKTKDLL